MSGKDKPNYWWSLLTMKCPRCRKGPMFLHNNPWNLKKTLKMPEKCPECGQHYELEVGFWYGTGYVSYALTVAMSVASFVAWWVLIGMSINDDRFFWWLGINAVLLVLLQPWIMRLSRVIYLYFFVRYDPNYKNTEVRSFDYETGGYYVKEPEKTN
jgi:uncharacterized protein (DUF983 family)